MSIDQSVLWQPQPGPQTALLQCPINEICFGGARGGGKTDGMLGHWLRHVELYGALAQGVFFRRRYKQLDRIRDRGKQLFIPLGAKFLSSKDEYRFVWPNGASLKLRHLERSDAWEEYQGHEYNWQCYEEATQWATPHLIDRMRATSRDSNHIPCFFLLTANPGGPGHNWVKERYIAPTNGKGYMPHMMMVRMPESGLEITKEAMYIPSLLWDNRKLIESDPEYIKNLYFSGPTWLVKAWLDGDWDIIAGGFLEGIWDHARHVIPQFEIPTSWPRWRAMDWGYAAPYSIGYYTMNPDTKVVTRYNELYGWGGSTNVGTRETVLEVKAKMLKLERFDRAAGVVFRKNPADRAMWSKIGNQESLIDLWRKGKVEHEGKLVDFKTNWIKADNAAFSRKPLAQLVIAALKHNQFNVTENCKHFIRTVPIIPADEDDKDDVDTTAEDHAFDEFKMSIASRRKAINIPDESASEPKPFTATWLEQVKDGQYKPPRPAARPGVRHS